MNKFEVAKRVADLLEFSSFESQELITWLKSDNPALVQRAVDGLKEVSEVAEKKEVEELITLSESRPDYGDVLEADLRISEQADDSGLAWNVVILRSGKNVSGTRIYEAAAIESASKFVNNLQCYADHPTDSEESSRPERSVKEIVGWFTDPIVESGELKATLNLLSPESSPIPQLPKMIKEAWKRGNKNIVGISIRGKGRTIKETADGLPIFKVPEIVSLYSADLVTRPGAGGRFIGISESEFFESERQTLGLDKVANSNVEQVSDNIEIEAAKEAVQPTTEKIGATESRLQEETKMEQGKETVVALDEAAILSKIEEHTKPLRLAERSNFLALKLTEAETLPTAVKEKIKKDFSGKEFTNAELETRVTEEAAVYEKVLSEFGVKSPVTGRLYSQGTSGTVTEDSRDKLEKAMYAMLSGEPAKDGIPAFRSVREAYVKIEKVNPLKMLDGDFSSVIMAGLRREPFLSESARGEANIKEAEIFSSTFTNIFGTSMHRLLVQNYLDESAQDNWRRIVGRNVTSFSDFKTHDVLHLGGYGALSSVNEGATYTEFSVPSEEKVSYAVTKKGNLVPVTMESFANDDLGALQQIPVKLGLSANEGLHRFVMDFMANNSTYDGDSTALQHSNHANTGTTGLARSTLLTAIRQMREQTGVDNDYVLKRITPRYLIVPNELEEMAYRLTASAVIPNIYPGSVTGTDASLDKVNPGEPNTVPMHLRAGSSPRLEVIVEDYWTDANNWWVVADGMKYPTVQVAFWNGRQTPELFIQDENTNGSVFNADKITWKIRFVYGGDIMDYRTFGGEIVG